MPEPQTDLDDFGSALVGARRRLGLSQSDLAMRLGTTQQTIGRWEQGQVPQPRFRVTISRFLDSLDTSSELDNVRHLNSHMSVGGQGRSIAATAEERALEVVLERLGEGRSIDSAEASLLREVLKTARRVSR